jgi:hypothetical protein
MSRAAVDADFGMRPRVVVLFGETSRADLTSAPLRSDRLVRLAEQGVGTAFAIFKHARAIASQTWEELYLELHLDVEILKIETVARIDGRSLARAAFALVTAVLAIARVSFFDGFTQAQSTWVEQLEGLDVPSANGFVDNGLDFARAAVPQIGEVVQLEIAVSISRLEVLDGITSLSCDLCDADWPHFPIH